MDPAGLPALQDAIRQLHGCESDWVESVPVVQKLQGKTVWSGEVQVFNLIGHPKAKRAYAWSHAGKGQPRRFVAILHLAPVDGPVTAVQVAIAGG